MVTLRYGLVGGTKKSLQIFVIGTIQAPKDALAGFRRQPANGQLNIVVFELRAGVVQKFQLPVITLAPGANQKMQPHLQPDAQ